MTGNERSRNRAIRRVAVQDLPVLSSWLSSAEIVKDYDTPTVVDPLELERRFERNGLNGPDVRWRVICSPTGEVVGLLTLAMDGANGAAEIGFAIPDSRKRRKGYAKAAVTAALEEIRLIGSVNKVKALVHPENKASIKLLECVGFRLCGVSKRHRFVRGRWQDFLVFSVDIETNPGRS